MSFATKISEEPVRTPLDGHNGVPYKASTLQLMASLNTSNIKSTARSCFINGRNQQRATA